MPTVPPTMPPAHFTEAQHLSGLEILEASQSETARILHRRFTSSVSNLTQQVQDAMVAEIHKDTLAILDKQGFRYNGIVLIHVFAASAKNESFVHLNNLAVVAEVLEECEKEKRDFAFSNYISGLQMYRDQSEPLIDWSSKSSEEQEIPKALIRAALGLKSENSQIDPWFSDSYRVSSEPLTELIKRRPRDVQRIIALVNERDLPVDTEQDIHALELLLDQGSGNALLRGVL